MNTLSSPSIDRNDLVNLISKSQEYIEILKSIVSIEDLQGVVSENLFAEVDSKFSPEELSQLEDKVSQAKIAFENDSAILFQLPGKPPVEYSFKQMGFRSQETKTWRLLIDTLSSTPHTFSFGVAYIYPDGSKKNRQKCRDYDAKWKILDELNKKLLVFFKREFNWNFPEGYKLYKSAAMGKDGDKSFKFKVAAPSSQEGVDSLDSIEGRFLSLDENDLEKEIRTLNDDFSVDSFVHNEPPELLVAALNAGRTKFGWSDKRVMEIIQY